MINWIDGEVRLQQHAAMVEQSEREASVEETLADWAAARRSERAARRVVRRVGPAQARRATSVRASTVRNLWRTEARALRRRAEAELWKPRWQDPGRYRTAIVLMLAVAIFSSAVRSGFSGDQNWVQFLATVLLFVGIQLPIFFAFNR